uniref:Uncharacterized protein n=1 Tax=Sphaerodactylus townsendi TaxID=933632 RepID=A0ACB8FE78_9SAUR
MANRPNAKPENLYQVRSQGCDRNKMDQGGGGERMRVTGGEPSAAARAALAMGHQQLYWSHPRKFRQGSRSCRVCSNRHGLIRKYGLNMCRQCFRQYAKDIGFLKLD